VFKGYWWLMALFLALAVAYVLVAVG